MRINKEKQKEIYGGTLSSTMLGCFIRGISILIDLGKSLGTSIRRATENKPCSY